MPDSNLLPGKLLDVPAPQPKRFDGGQVLPGVFSRSTRRGEVASPVR